MSTFTQLIEKVTTEEIMQVTGIKEIRNIAGINAEIKIKLVRRHTNSSSKFWLASLISKKFSIRILVDYYTRQLHIKSLRIDPKNTIIFGKLLTEITRNAEKFNFKRLTVTGTGDFRTKGVTYYVAPEYGFTPIPFEDLKILTLIHKYNFRAISYDGFFLDKKGLEFWKIHGRRTMFEFWLTENSKNISFLNKKLRNNLGR